MALVNVELQEGVITQMDEMFLERKDISEENDEYILSAVEYYHNGKQVHRSAHIHLKHPMIFSETAVAAF